MLQPHMYLAGGGAGDLQRIAPDSSWPGLSLAEEPLFLKCAGFLLLFFFPERDL